MATVRLKPVTDGNQTFWDWRSQFRAPDDRTAELKNLVGRQVYEAGFGGLRSFLADQTASPRPQVPEGAASVAAAVGGEHLSQAFNPVVRLQQ